MKRKEGKEKKTKGLASTIGSGAVFVLLFCLLLLVILVIAIPVATGFLT